MTAPLGKTTFGVTVWPVPAGRTPGQRTGLEHLTWGGPGDAVHLHTGGIARDGMAHPGRDTGNTISGPCQNDTEAQHAVDTYTAPPVGEILRTAAAVSATVAAEIRAAAESAYRQSRIHHHGEAWDQWAARQAVQEKIAAIATERDPQVKAALRDRREAFEHASTRYNIAAHYRDGDEYLDPGTPEGAAAYRAEQAAEDADSDVDRVRADAFERHHAQVKQAWREDDAAFLRAHGAEMKAALPGALKQVLANLADVADRAAEIKAVAAWHGLTVTADLIHDWEPGAIQPSSEITDATVTVEGTFKPGDAGAYAAARAGADTVLAMAPTIREGNVWGSGPASDSRAADLDGGHFRMTKGGIEIELARHLARATPRASGTGTRQAVTTVAAADYPHPLRPAAPGTNGTRATKPAGQQNLPRTRRRGR